MQNSLKIDTMSNIKSFFDSIPNFIAQKYDSGSCATSIDLDASTLDKNVDELFDSGFSSTRKTYSTSMKSSNKIAMKENVQATTFQQHQTKDPGQLKLDALENIYLALKKDNNYSAMIIKILLDQLKEEDEMMYKRFINDELLQTRWIPIININSKNTPYIEFLYKSDIAEEPPFDQLTDYSVDHYGFVRVIIDFIKSKLNANKATSLCARYSTASSMRSSTPIKSTVSQVKSLGTATKVSKLTSNNKSSGTSLLQKKPQQRATSLLLHKPKINRVFPKKVESAASCSDVTSDSLSDVNTSNLRIMPARTCKSYPKSFVESYRVAKNPTKKSKTLYP